MGIAATLVVCLSASTGRVLARESESTADARFLNGLRERQLYRLAVAFCEQRLADPKLDATSAADMAVQLSQTLVQQARQSPPDANQPLWDRAVQVVDEFVAKNPGSPWLTVVRVQGALVHVSRGELLQQIAELSGNNPKRIQEALEKLRLGIHQLHQLEAALEETLRRPPRAGAAGEPTRAQLLTVQRNVHYHLARAYRHQGQCYPPASADRDNALRQAAELFGRLARLDVNDDTVWDSRLEEVRCLRLMGNASLAARRLEQLAGRKPPPAIAMALRGERLRLLIEGGQVDAALRLADEAAPPDAVHSPHWDYARLETVLAAWQAAQANDKARAQQLEDKTLAIVRQIQETHDPYWSLLADTLLARTRMSAGLSGDVALLARAADGFLRSGQTEKAIEVYDQAAAKARESGQLDQAFDMAYLAASLEHQQKRHSQARQRFRALALAHREHPLAGDAHLLAIFHAGQEAQARQPIVLDEYVELVEEHLSIWSRSHTAGHAWWYLGRVRESQRQWEQAVTAYGQIAPDHERFGPAIDAISRCYETLLADMEAGGEATAELGRKAAQSLETHFIKAQGTLPERWSPTERQAALAAARLRMNYCDRDYGRAEQFLAAALQRGPEPEPRWKDQALAAWTAALTGLGRMNEAAQALAGIQGRDAPLWMTLLEDLARTPRNLPGKSWPEVGKLQLQAANVIRPLRAELDAHTRKRYDVLFAQATALAGDSPRAVQLFSELAKAFPRDAEIQESLGELLIQSSDQQSLAAALDLWRDVARKSREATPRWFRAKYFTALAHYKLGNRDQAKKLVEVLALLHPDLGGPELKAKYQALLK